MEAMVSNALSSNDIDVCKDAIRDLWALVRQGPLATRSDVHNVHGLLSAQLSEQQVTLEALIRQLCRKETKAQMTPLAASPRKRSSKSSTTSEHGTSKSPRKSTSKHNNNSSSSSSSQSSSGQAQGFLSTFDGDAVERLRSSPSPPPHPNSNFEQKNGAPLSASVDTAEEGDGVELLLAVAASKSDDAVLASSSSSSYSSSPSSSPRRMIRRASVVLDDDKAEQFLGWLRATHSEENMLFYKAALAFEESAPLLPPGRRKALAMKVWSRYIAAGSPCEVNIDMHLREQCTDAVNAAVVAVDAFSAAMDAVAVLINNSLLPAYEQHQRALGDEQPALEAKASSSTSIGAAFGRRLKRNFLKSKADVSSTVVESDDDK
jgi:Regulator of G protein signaling domain